MACSFLGKPYNGVILVVAWARKGEWIVLSVYSHPSFGELSDPLLLRMFVAVGDGVSPGGQALMTDPEAKLIVQTVLVVWLGWIVFHGTFRAHVG